MYSKDRDCLLKQDAKPPEKEKKQSKRGPRERLVVITVVKLYSLVTLNLYRLYRRNFHRKENRGAHVIGPYFYGLMLENLYSSTNTNIMGSIIEIALSGDINKSLQSAERLDQMLNLAIGFRTCCN